MTQTTNLAQAFTELLDDDTRARLRPTATITYLLGVAVDQYGWTVEQLATECSRDLDNATNIGAVITDRLRVAATVGPPAPKADPKRRLPGLAITHHGCCEDGWIYNEDVDPPTQTKCLGITTQEATA